MKAPEDEKFREPEKETKSPGQNFMEQDPGKGYPAGQSGNRNFPGSRIQRRR